MKGLFLDIVRAGIWLLLIVTVVLFSTGGFQEFIYRVF
jgi:hypothetical protein